MGSAAIIRADADGSELRIPPDLGARDYIGQLVRSSKLPPQHPNPLQIPKTHATMSELLCKSQEIHTQTHPQ
ncbi:hypothetical protein HaLaN_06214 [Haematococcus lacustris]|uniref:Uncharacterized protein n=1 Tax=Haematococcus lacustris TaxID=44745 RepID=A0A699YKP2_HAELA|nr:hypothetical protein HaLaN_06214 [Haematococcus lacustris]